MNSRRCNSASGASRTKQRSPAWFCRTGQRPMRGWRPSLGRRGSRTASTTGTLEGTPHQGSAGVEAMLQGDDHRLLVEQGVAHFAGPPLIEMEGDRATVLTYSLIMRREGDRHYVWRVSAVRCDVERVADRWRIRRRRNRLLDASGSGHRLFRESLQEFSRRLC